MCFSSGPRYGVCASCSPFTTFDTTGGYVRITPRSEVIFSSNISRLDYCPAAMLQRRTIGAHASGSPRTMKMEQSPRMEFSRLKTMAACSFGFGLLWLTYGLRHDYANPICATSVSQRRSDVEQTEENN